MIFKIYNLFAFYFVQNCEYIVSVRDFQEAEYELTPLPLVEKCEINHFYYYSCYRKYIRISIANFKNNC